MRISLLVSDLSANCVVRTYPIAKALERRFDVEVVGPVFGDGVFPPYRGEFDYVTVPGADKPAWADVERQLLEKVTGDVVYAFKPLPTSFGVARKWKKRTGGPVVLDVEDWEVGGARSVDNPALFWPYTLREAWRHRKNAKGHYFDLVREEKAARVADHVFVVSERLRDVMAAARGGTSAGVTKLPHGADTDVFDPAKWHRAAARDALGLADDEHVILFTGTPRKHKGLSDLVGALRARPDLRVRLVIVGGAEDDPALAALKRDEPRVTSLGYQPHARMPEFLAAADSVVLPQVRTLFTEAQVPGKVYEALAMGKPVIASRVSDLPEIVGAPRERPAPGAFVRGDAGMIVEPGDVTGVAAALDALVADDALRLGMGKRARERAVAHYSWDAMERILTPVFDQWA